MSAAATSSLQQREVARRFAPFAAVGILALATVVLPPAPSSWTAYGVAAALTLVISVAGYVVPWSRLPRWSYLAPPIGYLFVVALLRESQGGAASGYATLAILPIVWVALTLGKREVAIAVAAGTVVVIAPMLIIGSPGYPPSEWRRALLWVATGTLVGFAVNSLVTQARRQAVEAAGRADALALSEATIAAVMRVTRALGGDGDARRHACAGAQELCSASFAVIGEAADSGRLRVTAATGFESEVPPIGVKGGCAAAFSTRRRIVVHDATADERVSTALREATGARTVVFEPIIRDGRAVGVLVVGWIEPLVVLPAHAALALELLAGEVATAIHRDDLLERLQQTSVTDELTGLPNRRRWQDELPRALARAERSGDPVSVMMLDLDHFKAYNDNHGHQAGDALLRDVSAAWQPLLRSGDLLARYGGEEFAAVLIDADLAKARVVADRLRCAVPLGESCSAGVATWDRRESATELVRRADIALYAAKGGGRNRTEAAGPLDVPHPTRAAGAA